jgi:thioredoxin 1
LAPVLARLADDEPELLVLKVNIDECPDLARDLQIMSVPTLVLYLNGEMVARRTGFASLAQLRSWVGSNV